MSDRYKYKPLEHADSIRLLTLEIDGSQGTDIVCKLTNHRLSDHPPYIALSYAWGDPSDVSDIWIGDKRFAATKNVIAFLQEARRRFRYGGAFLEASRWWQRWLGGRACALFWIDAVCINQSNNEEKSAQVKQMSVIYEQARSIVVWLGESRDDSDLAMQTLRKIYHDTYRPLLLRNRGDHFKAREKFRQQSGPDTDLGELLRDSHTRHAIATMCKRPWWMRMWVYQEVSAPSQKPEDMMLWCGFNSIELEAVTEFRRIVTSIPVTNPEYKHLEVFDEAATARSLLMDAIKQCRRLKNISGERSKGLLKPDLDSLFLLYATRGCEASDPRDMLYSLYTLCNRESSQACIPDYSISAQQAYIRFGHQTIKRQGHLDILGFAAGKLPLGFLEGGRVHGLPSWVPDWTAQIAPFQKFTTGSQVSLLGGRRPIFAASKNRPLEFSFAQSYLYIRGIIFDVVKKCGPEARGGAENSREAPPLVTDTLFAMESLFAGSDEIQYPAGGSQLDALRHTLTIDACSTLDKVELSRGWKVPKYALRPGALEDSVSEKVVSLTDLASVDHLCLTINARRLALSNKGYYCLISRFARPDDIVVILYGGVVPYILREHDGHFTFQGEAYVHGIMDGEALDGLEDGSVTEQVFEIR